MSLPSSIVPAYPYEGGLYWLISEGTTRHSRSHPYYSVLYGLEPEKTFIRAAALSCLFDRIELASADHAYPDSQKFRSGDNYFHPDLRLSVSHGYHEFPKEGRAFADYINKKKILREQFRKHSIFRKDTFSREHFLIRLFQQVRLAIRHDAVIIGDEYFQACYRLVAPYIKQFIDDTPGPLPDGITLALDENTLSITGLNFAPSNFDSFVNVRTSKEISEYATSFRDAIDKSRTSSNQESSLIEIMREAMETEKISTMAAGALQTSGSVLNVAGMIPILGTAASIADTVSDIAERAASAKAKKNSWYLLGSKMKEIEIKSLLTKKQEG